MIKIAWNDTQTATDSITYLEWNAMVTYVEAVDTKTSYDGSDCSGSDGTANRTLTHTSDLTSSHKIFVGGTYLHETSDYTYTGAIITFIIIIDNTDKIVLYN